jgi:hypothetical protein
MILQVILNSVNDWEAKLAFSKIVTAIFVNQVLKFINNQFH